MSPKWFGRSYRAGPEGTRERAALVRVLKETAGPKLAHLWDEDGPYWPMTLFSLLVRRKFGDADSREVTRYLAQARTREPLIDSDDRLLRAAEVVIRGELGAFDLFEPEVCDADEFVRLIHLVVIDLMRTSEMPADLLGGILAGAQRDADRVMARMSAKKLSLAEVVADRLRPHSTVDLDEWIRR